MAIVKLIPENFLKDFRFNLNFSMATEKHQWLEIYQTIKYLLLDERLGWTSTTRHLKSFKNFILVSRNK